MQIIGDPGTYPPMEVPVELRTNMQRNFYVFLLFGKPGEEAVKDSFLTHVKV
jgi:hypothetical protein